MYELRQLGIQGQLTNKERPRFFIASPERSITTIAHSRRGQATTDLI
jgi:hypothetical protein